MLAGAAGVYNRKATLSDQHTADPLIPASPEVEVTIGPTTATATPDFSDIPGVTLSGNVSMEEISPRLQAAIRQGGTEFATIEVHVFDNKLLVLSEETATDPVEFEIGRASCRERA